MFNETKMRKKKAVVLFLLCNRKRSRHGRSFHRFSYNGLGLQRGGQ